MQLYPIIALLMLCLAVSIGVVKFFIRLNILREFGPTALQLLLIVVVVVAIILLFMLLKNSVT